MIPIDDYDRDESWYGSYYELAMEISAGPDDGALAAATQRLWTADLLVGGPWRDRHSRDVVRAPALVEPEGMASTYGVLEIPGLGNVRCVSWVIREEGGGSDWLDVSIPTSALTCFTEAPRRCIDSIDRALVNIAAHVYSETPFLLGVVGEEVSGTWSAATVTGADLMHGGFLVPRALVQRIGAPLPAEEVSPELHWFPLAGIGS